MRTQAVVLLGCIILCLTGCQRASGTRPGVVTIWESYNNEEHRLFDQLARKPFEEWYQAKHGKSIEVKVDRVPFGGLLPKLKMACQTSTTPDICRVDVAQVVQLAFGKAVVPLDELEAYGGGAPDKLRDEYVAAAFDSNLVEVKQADGKWAVHLFGLPDSTNCLCLFYNKRLFRENAGRLKAADCDPGRAPVTWQEFVRYARALTLPGKKQYGFAMDNSLWWTLPFFNSWGASFVDRDPGGKLVCTLAGQRALEAFSFKVGLYQDRFSVDGVETRAEAGAWIPGAVSPLQGFANGSYAMILSGPWNLDNLRGTDGVDLGVSMIPAGPEGSSSTTGGTNMVVFKASPNKEASYQFLRFITSAGFQKKWAGALGKIPVRPDVMDKIDLTEKPELTVFYQQMLNAKARPPIPGYDRLEELVNPELELGLKGQKSPEEALRSAASSVEEQVLSRINEL